MIGEWRNKMRFTSKRRIALAFVVSSLVFFLIFWLLPLFLPLSYVPYWSGGRPAFDFKTDYGILVLVVPIFWLIALIGQLVLVLPFVIYLQSTKFKNFFVVSIYVMFAYCLTYYFLQYNTFQPPTLLTGKNGLGGELLPLSEVDPERYAVIYEGWKRNVIRRCILICSSGLIAGAIFWRIYSGSFRCLSRKTNNLTS